MEDDLGGDEYYENIDNINGSLGNITEIIDDVRVDDAKFYKELLNIFNPKRGYK